MPERNLRQKYGISYTLITGGTDGIGLELAKKIAAQGSRVLLVGKRTDSVKDFMISNLGQMCDLKEMDLGDDAKVSELLDWIRVNKPSLLINSAGLCVPDLLVNIEDIEGYTKAHITSLTKITQEFLRHRPQKSGVVFFSSQVSIWSNPYAGLYSSTKAFTSQLARSIAVEYPDVDTLVIYPGAVNGTSFFNAFPDFWMFNVIRSLGQSKDTVASLILKALGRVHSIDSGVYTHLSRLAVSFVDENLIDFFAEVFSKPLRNIIMKRSRNT